MVLSKYTIIFPSSIQYFFLIVFFNLISISSIDRKFLLALFFSEVERRVRARESMGAEVNLPLLLGKLRNLLIEGGLCDYGNEVRY